MSDPVTNVEIEDVLSSIRRLVSDGDKARTRDPAPDAVAARPVEDTARPDVGQPSESARKQPVEQAATSARQDKLVLTPAFLVVDSETDADLTGGDDRPEDTADTADENVDGDSGEADVDAHEEQDADVEDAQTGDDAASDEDTEAEPVFEHRNKVAAAPAAAEDEDEDEDGTDAASDEPLTLTNLVWDRPDAGDKAAVDLSTPDRSDLVATIAELEAAIRPDKNEYEPDGNEPMAETIAWPGTVARSFSVVEDAETVEPDKPDQPASQQDAEKNADADDDSGAAAQRTVEAASPSASRDAETTENTGKEDRPTAQADSADRQAQPVDTQQDVDDYGDDDLDGLPETGDGVLDDAALRQLVADVVHEELTGALGERITRNVRKLVRREIYRVLSSQEFD